jgi:hypothetical protein
MERPASRSHLVPKHAATGGGGSSRYLEILSKDVRKTSIKTANHVQGLPVQPGLPVCRPRTSEGALETLESVEIKGRAGLDLRRQDGKVGTGADRSTSSPSVGSMRAREVGWRLRRPCLERAADGDVCRAAKGFQASRSRACRRPTIRTNSGDETFASQLEGAGGVPRGFRWSARHGRSGAD